MIAPTFIDIPTQAIVAHNIIQQTYEASVIKRAYTRAGKNPYLKGHIHEILFQDKQNLVSLVTAQNTHTRMTASPIAPEVDLIKQRHGKTVKRFQLKDLNSQAAVNKLIRDVKQGKYRTVTLIGPPETTQKFNKAAQKAGIQKRMHSSGISTHTTAMLAQKAGAKGSGTPVRAVATSARIGGTFGMILGASIEMISIAEQWKEGQLTNQQAANRVITAGTKSAVAGATGAATATLATAALAATGATGATLIILPVVISTGAVIATAWAFDALVNP